MTIYLFLATAGAAAAQDLVLRADPVPIVAARINDRDVRLEVDPSLQDVLVLNPDTAERIGVRTVPFTRVQVKLDEASLLGRLARPRMRFADGTEARPFAGVFPAPGSRVADGVIGPGVLPHNRVTIRLAEGEAGREIVLPVEDADVWAAQVEIAPGVMSAVDVSLTRERSLINRPVVRALEERRLLQPAGPLGQEAFILGLTTSMQPVEVDGGVRAGGIALGSSLALTGAPIIGADEEDAIVVAAEGRKIEPRATLGRAALAGCTSITMDRAAKRLTLRCP